MAPTIAVPPKDRTLRIITILVFPLAFALLIPHAVNSEYPMPAVGLTPMFISACAGAVHLSAAKPAKYGAGSMTVDVFCAVFLISCLIPSWVYLARGENFYNWSAGVAAGTTMLGSYGSACMMVSFVIHTYIVLREFRWRHWFTCFSRKTKTCPHCQGDLRPRTRNLRGDHYQQASGEDDAHSNHSKESFQDTEQGDYHIEGGPSMSAADPRPSTDDETARLV